MRIYFIVVCIVLVVLIVLCYLTKFREKSIFQVRYDDAWFPVQYHEEFYIDDCHTLFFDNDSDRVIVYCHGNYGNISYYSHMPLIAKRLGISLIMYDYRGFGKSRGIASTSNIKEDGINVYSYVKNIYEENNIIVWGESLGGSIASWIACNNNPSKVVLVSTFSDIHDVIKMHSKGSLVIEAIIAIADILYDSLPIKEWIGKIKSPICLIHSTEDTYIPYECSIINSKVNTKYLKEYITIKGDHTTPEMNEENVTRLSHFLETSICYKDFINDFVTISENSALNNIN